MKPGPGEGARSHANTSSSLTSLFSRAGWRRITALISAMLVAAVGLTALIGGGSADATLSAKTHMVPGVLAGLSRATHLSAANPATQMRIGVAITSPHPAAELALQKAIYTKGSSEYHHFLTVAQFQQRFGVGAATTRQVESYLTGGGLSISHVEPGGGYILATGSVRQLDRLFKVSIGRYHSQGKTFLANDLAPSVPNGLAITAVLGLDTVQQVTLDSLHGHRIAYLSGARARSAHGVRTATARSYLVHSGRAGTQSLVDPCVNVQAGCEQTYTPQETWGLYDMPGASTLPDATTGLTTPAELEASNVALGQGQTIGVFGEGETSSIVPQLRLFEAATGMPKIPTRTIETEGGPDSSYGDNSGAVEWYLDSQSSTGMAPDAKQLDFYFAKTLFDGDIVSSFSDWANDTSGPKEMNASFGECEENSTNNITGPLAQMPYGTELGDELEAAAEPILEQATMEGRTLFSSAGDTGSGCPEVAVPVAGAGNGVAPQPVPLVGYPCASDYVVCVGGTVVSSPGTTYPTKANQRTAETSWSTGGGGSSAYIAEPSWQMGVAHVNHDCISEPSGQAYATTTPCRGVPDVSDLSGNIEGDGYFIYTDGEPSSEGGTSLSSPLMMGQWARLQSAASTSTQSSGGVGFADPLIYQAAASADTCSAAPCTGTYAKDFNDVTASELNTGNGVYQPGPGWDYASGWGSLDLANFMSTVDGSTTSPIAYTGAEQPAVSVCTASMNSPAGNATDPADVSLGNLPGADLLNATLTSPSASTITATITVADLPKAPPSEFTNETYYVAWEYNGIVYYAAAAFGKTGEASATYTSGNTGPFETAGSPNAGQYTATSGSAATGKISGNTIIINVPTKEVGAPAAGAMLTNLQAFTQVSARISLTADSSDNVRAYSTDNGQLDSIGLQVPVAGVLGSNCTNSLPVTDGATSGVFSPGNTTTTTTPTPTPTKTVTKTTPSAKLKAPTTRITHKAFSRHGAKLSGTATAYDGHKITSVALAIARTVKRGRRVECEFLTAKHRWSRAGSCAPHDYLKARGTKRWSFSLRLGFTKGVYYLWEHAEDNHKLITRNTAAKHVFFRIG